MSLFQLSESPVAKRTKRILETAAVVALISSGILISSTATAAPSWNKKPDWADEEPTPIQRKKRESSSQVSAPFAPGSHNISVDVGQVFLMGDLGTNFNDSIGGQIHYAYGVSDMFAFDTSLGFSSHSEGKFSMMTGLAGMRMNLTWFDKIVPFARLGMGFYRPSFQMRTPVGINNIEPVLFGLNLGPGVHLELTRQLFFGASLNVHNIFGTKQTLSDGTRLDVGGSFTTFFLHAGVTF